MTLDPRFMLDTLLLTLKAAPVTLNITLVSLALALPAGFFLALCRVHRVRLASPAAAAYISCVRGPPVVLQILIVYSLLPSVLNAAARKLALPLDVFALNPIIYAYTVFALNSSAALAEIFRSALLTVNRGQMEAALACGLTTAQSYRYVVLPQALCAAAPNICNLTINLIKNTSLAFLMTVREITAEAKIAASFGYKYIEAYLDVFVVYIVICAVTEWLFRRGEARLSKWKRSSPHA
jgi:L-cystine transport system permease protein